MSKLVSIILPTYNGEKFLRQSIDSCLSQSYQNIELIVINDCSTDGSEEVIKSYKDERLKYYVNESNLKLPASLNRGFSLATGDYFTWTSDDNYFDGCAIETMVRVLEQSKSDLVYANYHTIDDSNNLTGVRLVGDRKDILLDNVVKACFLYKREVQNTLKGYKTDLFLVEDYDFWIRAAFHGFKFTPINEMLYYYRFHEGSLTESRRQEISKRLLQLLQSHLIAFKKEKKNEFINYKLHLKIAKLHLANGERGMALHSLRKAIIANPFSLLSKEFIISILKTVK